MLVSEFIYIIGGVTIAAFIASVLAIGFMDMELPAKKKSKKEKEDDINE